MPRSEPPSNLQISVNKAIGDIEVVNLRVQEMDQRLTNRLETLTESVQAMTDQIGRMAEAITRLEVILTEGTRKRDEQIDRLLGILERLVPAAR